MIKIIALNNIVVYHFWYNWYINKLVIKNPIIFPKLDFDDHIPTKVPYYLILKYWLNIVIRAGKKKNWKKPNVPNENNIIKYVKIFDYLSFYYPFINDINGIILNEIAVGMAVWRHINFSLLFFNIEYRKNVPIDNDKNIVESIMPRKKLRMANFYYKWCLFELYVIRIILIDA